MAADVVGALTVGLAGDAVAQTGVIVETADEQTPRADAGFRRFVAQSQCGGRAYAVYFEAVAAVEGHVLDSPEVEDAFGCDVDAPRPGWKRFDNRAPHEIAEGRVAVEQVLV